MKTFSKTSTGCSLCEGFIEAVLKVRDHCHSTGKYSEAAHQDCSKNIKNHYLDLFQ